MDLKDTYCYMVSAYYGIFEMDEYDVKEFVLKDIANYIKDFIESNPIPDFDYYQVAEEIEKNNSLKTKLQDSLLILPKINAPMDLILLVKARIKRIREEEMEAYN